MDHWLIAVAAPLFEINPVKYTFDAGYRNRVDALGGRRARRVYRYQLLVIALMCVTMTWVGWWFWTQGGRT